MALPKEIKTAAHREDVGARFAELKGMLAELPPDAEPELRDELEDLRARLQAWDVTRVGKKGGPQAADTTWTSRRG